MADSTDLLNDLLYGVQKSSNNLSDGSDGCSEDFSPLLLSCIQRYPVMWDRNHPGFKSRGKQQEWINIEHELGIGGHEKNGWTARRKWIAMLAQYRRQIERLATGGKVTFPHYEQMKEFVDPNGDADDDIEVVLDTTQRNDPSTSHSSPSSSSHVPKSEPDLFLRNFVQPSPEPETKRKRIPESVPRGGFPQFFANVPMPRRSFDIHDSPHVHMPMNAPSEPPPPPSAPVPPPAGNPGCFVSSQGDAEFYSFIEETIKKLPIHQRFRAQGDICKYLTDIASGKERNSGV